MGDAEEPGLCLGHVVEEDLGLNPGFVPAQL